MVEVRVTMSSLARPQLATELSYRLRVGLR
jgi:hypothetical protein